MNTDELRTLQLAELKILDEFVRICGEHQLRYYLNAGTLLGAVRHKGFIPWDDDIDLCMPRSDYERFLAVVDSSLPENMRAVHFRTQKEGELLQYSCQIIDLDVPLIQRIAGIPRETCAWIDVFPMDGMPKNGICRKIHGFHLLYRRAMMQFSMFDRNVNVKKAGRPFHERALIKLCQRTHIGKRLSPRGEMEKLDRVLKKYPDDKSVPWINFMGAYKLKETFPADFYGDGTAFEFEGRRLPGPEKAHEILTALFGDYMTLRPPAAEEGHNLEFREKEPAAETNTRS